MSDSLITKFSRNAVHATHMYSYLVRCIVKITWRPKWYGRYLVRNNWRVNIA